MILCVLYAALVWTEVGTPTPYGEVLSAWFGANLLLAVGLLAYRLRSAADRTALTPVLFGTLAAVMPMVALFVLPSLAGRPPLAPVEYVAIGFLAIPASFAYTIVRHRLFSLDGILRPYLVRIGTALAAALLFAAVLAAGLVAQLAVEAASLIGAVVVALTATTVQQRVERLINATLFSPLLRATDVLAPEATNAPDLALATTARLRELVPTRWAACFVTAEWASHRGAAEAEWLALAVVGDPPRSIATEHHDPRLADIPRTAWVPIGPSEQPVALLGAGPRVDGSALVGIDLDVMVALARQAHAPLEAALLRERALADERFRAGLSGLVRELAAAPSVADVLQITGVHSRILLGGLSDAGRISFAACGTEDGASSLSDMLACLREVGVPAACLGDLLESRAVLYEDRDAPGHHGLAFALGGLQGMDACVAASRGGSLPPFDARDLQRAREIAEHAGGALRRAAVAAQAAEAEALREVDRVRTELLDMVSHDLQNPLAIVGGYAELLETRLRAADDEVLEMVRQIRAAARTSSRLVQDLLTSARMDRGRLTLHLQAVDLAASLDGIAQGYRALPNGERLKVEVGPGLRVQADPLRLEQMLTNLISNAFRYAPRGPIVLRGRLGAGGTCVVEVEDRGPGITPAEQPRVWEKFYRAVGAERVRGGTGLGLTLVRSLAELHGGRVELESTPGVGSIFRLVLPSGTPLRRVESRAEWKLSAGEVQEAPG